jgi:serine protease Do
VSRQRDVMGAMPTLVVGMLTAIMDSFAWPRKRGHGTRHSPLSRPTFGRCPGRARVRVILAIIIACVVLFASTALADDLDSLEQKAITAAIDRVAPSVVRIDTLGGLEQAEEVSIGTGPTTGLIVDPEGYIVSSAFGFSNKPTSIIVRLPDGARKPAKLVATDHVRMIVLLKIDADKPLPVCEPASTNDMRVGQWTVAIGRTFEGERPNVSVGILSAKDRVWGKAIQTDASVSPANYGGPLVDIRGRVMGLLVPLSPESADEAAGYEWYDSGIGFAIPADHIQKFLPRLKKGEDLRQGFVGVSFQSKNIYLSEPVIAVCRPNSPAAEGGLKPGDRIVAVEGRDISRAAEFREELNRRYAGDKINLTVQRGAERLKREITLTDKIPPYERPFIGILLMRDGGESGVIVRYVYPKSPAAKIDLIPGDVILAIDGVAVKSRDEMIEALIEHQPGQNIDLEIFHDNKKERRKLTLAGLSETVPPETLPPACKNTTPEKDDGLELGAITLKIPQFPNEVMAYVPDNYNPKIPYGLVVFLHGGAGLDWDKTLAAWKPLCQRYNLILAAPRPTDKNEWTPPEAELVSRLIGKISALYNVDPLRVVLHGYETGGTLASIVATRNREIIRALAVVEAPMIAVPQENDPQYRFDVYLAASNKSRGAKSLKKVLSMLNEMKIPLIEIKLGDEPRYLNAEELDELARWTDTLDRI